MDIRIVTNANGTVTIAQSDNRCLHTLIRGEEWSHEGFVFRLTSQGLLMIAGAVPKKGYQAQAQNKDA